MPIHDVFFIQNTCVSRVGTLSYYRTKLCNGLKRKILPNRVSRPELVKQENVQEIFIVTFVYIRIIFIKSTFYFYVQSSLRYLTYRCVLFQYIKYSTWLFVVPLTLLVYKTSTKLGLFLRKYYFIYKAGMTLNSFCCMKILLITITYRQHYIALF